MRLAVAIAIIAFLALAAHADEYGFTHTPGNYDDDYRENQWKCSEAHRYQPGYHRCSGDDQWHDEGKRKDDR